MTKSWGQATTEYIMLLAIVTMMAVVVKRAMQPMIDRLSGSFSRQIESMFDQANLHRLRIGQ
jgi:hypothetical protein